MSTDTKPDIQDCVEQAWELFEQHFYKEGFALWEALPCRPGNVGLLRHEGKEQLMAGDWKGAVAQFVRARHIYPYTFSIPEIGIALWLSGLREAACHYWANEIKRIRSQRMDPSDGIASAALLWWAAAHHEQRGWRKLATSELRQMRSKPTLRARGWPGPIGDFLLGDISEEMLLWAASSCPGTLQQRYCLQAWFYIGANRLALGDRQGYIDSVAQAREACARYVDSEYALVWWIHRMHPNQLALEMAE